MVEIPTQKKKNKMLLFLMAVLFAISFLLPISVSLTANATSNRVTSVIEDLQTDPNFKVEDYPSKSDDYSLKVIQIAESTAKELFIYVYQPSATTKELTATSINISTAINESLHYKNYKLTLLNYRGVFQKYVVEDFYVKNDALRYYDISSIFRAWNKDIDESAGGGNTISERSFAVGQLWTACTVNNNVTYNYTTIDTIEVVSKYVGFVRYAANDVTWYANKIYNACDSHYVAFSTDKPIEKLIEADVLYTKQSVVTASQTVTTYGEIQENNYAYLKADDVSFYEGKDNLLLKGNKYSWKKIQKSSEFINNNDFSKTYEHGVLQTTTYYNLKEADKNEISKQKWVLCFAETEYKTNVYVHTGKPSTYKYNFTMVSDVSILRLKFETNGVTYNLGVVDNKQTGSRTPSNEIKTETKINMERLMEIIEKALLVIGLLLCLPIIIFLLPFIIKAIIWVVTLPFKLAKDIFKMFKRKT